MKCSVCKKPTSLKCVKCGVSLCVQHGHPFRKAIYCDECYYQEKKVGLIKLWVSVFILLGFALFMINIVK